MMAFLLTLWKYKNLILMVAALAGAFWGGMYLRGLQAEKVEAGIRQEIAQANERAAQIARQREKAAREIEQMAQSEAEAAARETELRRQLLAEQQRSTTKEVIKYVQDPNHTVYTLDYEWVRIVDSAAQPGTGVSSTTEDTESGSIPLVASRGVTTDEALGVIKDNYDACNRNADRLEGWQRWYARIKPILDANAGVAATGT